jgi:hypothetical protein
MGKAKKKRQGQGVPNKGTQAKAFNQKIFSWPVMGAICPLLLAMGVTFMIAGLLYVADALFVLTGVIFLWKFLTWESSKAHERRMFVQIVSVIIAIVVSGGGIAGNHYLNRRETLNSPKFLCDLYVLPGNLKLDGQSLIIVVGTIQNPTGPSSAIVGWKMTVEFPDGNKIVGDPQPINKNDYDIPISSMKNAKLILRVNEFWPITTLNPIIKGGVSRGWFWSTFKKLDLKEVYNKKAVIVVAFKDVVSSRNYTCRLSMPEMP